MSVNICGFALPAVLVRVAADEGWTAYTESDRLPPGVVERVFGEAPSSTWKFYTLDEARMMTEEWQQESDHDWFGRAPDDIAPLMSVLVGELGYDRPFALDYRTATPVVRFMLLDGRWVQVADTAEALLAALGIDQA